MTNSDSAKIPVFSNADELHSWLKHVPADEMISITAPLETKERIIIGLYSPSRGYACVDIDKEHFKVVSPVLYEPRRNPIAVHGIKRIWEELQISEPDVKLGLITCTKIIAYLLRPEWKAYQYSLSSLSETYLAKRYPYTPKDIYGAPFPYIFYDILIRDAHLIHDLAKELTNRMDEGLRWLYEHVELPVAVILNQMTLSSGLRVDEYACFRERTLLQQKITDLESRIFNPDEERVKLRSPAQIYEFLVTKIPIKNKHAHTNKEVRSFLLDELACDYEIASWISEWKELDAGLRFLHAALRPEFGGRLKSNWHQTIAKTGRIVATSQPVQNIKREYRQFFVPDPGWIIIKADYSQSQLRLLAHLSEDEELIKAYDEDRDLHLDTALRHGSEDRNFGKDINFSICFGVTPKGLAGRINKKKRSKDEYITSESAKAYIEAWYKRFPKVKPFFKENWNKLKEQDPKDIVVRSHFGRLRRFTADTPGVRRQFRAQLLQSFEADLLKLAMIRIQRSLDENHCKGKIVMAIHDSLWIHAPIEEKDLIEELVRREMTGDIPLRVPLRVDIETVGFETPNRATMTPIFSQESFK